MKPITLAYGTKDVYKRQHSINNVVDISNIVMLETGQPMHFYDKDAIKNQEITVVDGVQEDYRCV